MKMKAYGKMKILTVVFFVLAFLLLCASTSFAWLTSNRKLRSNGMRMEAGAVVREATIKVYPVTQIDGNNYTFDTSLTSTALPKYDKYGIDAKEYEKALVIHISFYSETDATHHYANLTMVSDTAFPVLSTSEWEAKTQDYISNVVSFSTVSGVNGNVATRSAAAAISFLDYDSVNGTFSKPESTVSLLQNYALTGGGVPNDIYLIMTYHPQAVDYFCNHTVNEVTYVNDIVFKLDGSEDAA